MSSEDKPLSVQFHALNDGRWMAQVMDLSLIVAPDPRITDSVIYTIGLVLHKEGLSMGPIIAGPELNGVLHNAKLTGENYKKNFHFEGSYNTTNLKWNGDKTQTLTLRCGITGFFEVARVPGTFFKHLAIF